MTTEIRAPWQIGRLFNIKLESGITELECIHWDDERRAFKATDDSGFLDLDWMEYSDQLALGRIDLVGLPGYPEEINIEVTQ